MKVLIVEDEMIIAANISMQLTKLGYHVNAILSRGEDALTHVVENETNVVLLDIQLKGKWDGIRTAEEIKKVQKPLFLSRSRRLTYNVL